MSDRNIYRVIFINQNKVYEIYAKSVYQGDLYGFVIIEDFIFGERSEIVIDPSEDKIRTEFEGVQRSFVPMHEVIRIDQVKRSGTAKIIDNIEGNRGTSNVASLYPAGSKKQE